MKYKIAAALLAVSFLVPVAAMAIDSNTSLNLDSATSASTSGLKGSTSKNSQTKISLTFCTNLAVFTAKVNARIAKAQTNLTAKEQAIVTSLQERQTKSAQRLADSRAKQDQTRTAIYAKLTVKATTLAEKQAVITFQTSVEAAVTVRRNAVDTAILIYWTGVKSAIADRQTAVQTAQQNFLSSMTTALATASSQCASGTAAAIVRENFATSAKTAKTKLTSDRKAIDKAGPQIKVLAQTRNASIKTAWTNFGKALEQAGALLKAAFPSTTSDSGSVHAKIKANFDLKSLKK